MNDLSKTPCPQCGNLVNDHDDHACDFWLSSQGWRPGPNELTKAHTKVRRMSDTDIQIVWDALYGWDEYDLYAPGVTMDEWAELVYSEITYRRVMNPQNF